MKRKRRMSVRNHQKHVAKLSTKYFVHSFGSVQPKETPEQRYNLINKAARY